MHRFAVLAAILGLAAPSSAQEAPPPQEPRWSVGAGLALSTTTVASTPASSLSSGGASILAAAPAVQPVLGLFLELRLARSTWLVTQAQASYLTGSSSGRDSEQGVLAVNAGVRQVFNPGGRIEVSGFVVAGVAYGTTSATGVTLGEVNSKTSASVTSEGLSAGLALERELVDALYLRLSSGIVAASYYELSSSASTRKTDGLSLGLRFTPGIEVRYQF
jgi:hypothetical protein